MAKAAVITTLETIAQRVADPHGIEIVEVELKGGGKNQFLRVSIDKPEGVTHGDCETVSRELGDVLDAEDTITSHYTLEVSSPGVERKLLKPSDWVRFAGKRAKVVLLEPRDGRKTFEGTISQSTEPQNGSVALTLPDGKSVEFPFTSIDRANLKFDW